MKRLLLSCLLGMSCVAIKAESRVAEVVAEEDLISKALPVLTDAERASYVSQAGAQESKKVLKATTGLFKNMYTKAANSKLVVLALAKSKALRDSFGKTYAKYRLKINSYLTKERLAALSEKVQTHTPAWLKSAINRITLFIKSLDKKSVLTGAAVTAAIVITVYAVQKYKAAKAKAAKKAAHKALIERYKIV